MSKPYSQMTEQERKKYFGYGFKRTNPQDVPEAYIVDMTPDTTNTGYGVVSRDIDPQNKYDINEVKQYFKDYPEMLVPGWLVPPTPQQEKLKQIRTSWVFKNDSTLKSELFSTQSKKFVGDDIWGGDSDVDLITWKGEAKTCDQISTLITQYTGEVGEEEKINQLIELRNTGKAYLRTAAEKFIAEHSGKPEEYEIPKTYIND